MKEVKDAGYSNWGVQTSARWGNNKHFLSTVLEIIWKGWSGNMDIW